MPQGFQAGTGQAGALPHQASIRARAAASWFRTANNTDRPCNCSGPPPRAVASVSSFRHTSASASESVRRDGIPWAPNTPEDTPQSRATSYSLIKSCRVTGRFSSSAALNGSHPNLSSSRATRIATQRESRPESKSTRSSVRGAGPSSTPSLFSLSQQQFPAAQKRRSQQGVSSFIEVSRH